MAELKRTDPHPSAGAGDRDSRAEALLVEGLDQYFAGHFEDAINLWTRVLFLDRSHARARAYIDRARTALAERQRRAEEILHAADDRITTGDLDGARRLVSQAVALAGEDERVAVLRTRLDRIERAGFGQEPLPDVRGAVVDVVPLDRPKRRVGSLLALVAAGASGGLLVMLLTSPAVRNWLAPREAASAPATPAEPESVPVLSAEDVAFVRARTLYAHGRLAEALAALDRVSDASADAAAANRLRAEIQQLLLATRPVVSAPQDHRSLAGRP